MSDTKIVHIVEQYQGEEEREYAPDVPLATRLRIEREHLLAG